MTARAMRRSEWSSATSRRPTPGRAGGAAAGRDTDAARRAGPPPASWPAGQLLRRLPARLPGRLGRTSPDVGGGGHGRRRAYARGDGAPEYAKPDGGAWTVINGGSAGVGFGGDRASYAWLEGDRRGWRAEIRRMDYDHQALERGLPASPALVVRGRRVGRDVPALPRSPGSRGSPISCGGCGSQCGDEPTDMARGAAALRCRATAPGRWAFPLAA